MRRDFLTFGGALRRGCVAGALALALNALPAMAQGQRASSGILAVIPFTVDSGHIFVAPLVNGRPASFVIDTGSGVDVVESESAARLGISASPQGDSAVVTGTGGTARAYFATIARIQLGSVQIAKSPAYLLHVAQSVRCDGLLGYEFLRRYLVTFDFQRHVMILRRPGAALPGQCVIPFVLSGGVPSVVGEAGGWPGRFLIDTGYGGTVVLNAPFVAKYHLRDRYAQDGRMVAGRGIGGRTQSDLVQLDSFQLGRVPVDGILAELTRQTQGAFAASGVAGTIGIEVLDRYLVTLDYPGGRMILAGSGARP
ncbi:hypothetical protein CCAX7_004610 [Capsulimonas corticalis]|uniref:Uncharacterized protein n=1 Tax=Capsulimonas corticalis TaxID=2219043 RepID=A0A402D2X4_9BACT|nr:aspartyl protease family protein [Capsulimonas corticalis]BDI28410.1 hypothetical protein CCAX7_004610 [Capsulimonas corticalis]